MTRDVCAHPSVFLLVVFAHLCGLATPSTAFPPGFYTTPVANDWNQALGLAFAPDSRLFVWEKAGRVWNVENGIKAAQPLIDISEEVGDWRDYGLLGFAIDPDFYTNGYIYLLYVVDYHHVLFYGTPNYNPGADWYFQDTIARITRYTCNPGDGFRSVLPGTRHVLIGESINTGFPICHQSHGIGSIVFGEDGTLLASCGDGASYESVDTGTPTSGSSNTCLSDGIISAKEDVGAFRSQLIDSLCGKVVRIDPATGDGVPSNPFYDSGDPRSAKSRMWVMGLRNPFRLMLRPGTGLPDPALADPGTLYIGDVGWGVWEELNVAKTGGINFGWPLFEGLEEQGWGYHQADIGNLDAPNPLFGQIVPGFGLCTQEHFLFRNLLIQDTLNPASWPNPCDTGQGVPSSIPRFEHVRSPVDWGHGGPSRTPIFNGNDAAVVDLNDPGSPIPGPWFAGSSSTGGTWYSGVDFPGEYQHTYFHADFAGQWIRQLIFDGGDNVVEVRDFAGSEAGAVVAVATDPVAGGLHFISYDQAGCCSVRKLSWVNNVPPTAVAQGTPVYGPAPLAVQFSGGNSTDPDGNVQDMSFLWDFGDGTPPSREVDPVHTYPSEDISSQGTFVGRIFQLNPPNPQGGGNWNPEIMRDGDYPPEGNQDSGRQFDTFHFGDQGGTDWIGYTLAQPRELRKLVFQEGIHFWDGGWFENLRVQVRIGGNWVDVAGLVTTPPYAGNNGVSYETYEFRFDPVTATGIRLFGDAPGFASFISVGELRVVASPLSSLSAPTRFDATLTVVDGLGGQSSTGVSVFVNDTPPSVSITNPVDETTLCLIENETLPLTAIISDAEHGPAELTCEWQTILHHNEHTHPEPPDSNCATQTVLSPHGSGLETYYYEITLTVADPLGLSTRASATVFANCEPAKNRYLSIEAHVHARQARGGDPHAVRVKLVNVPDFPASQGQVFWLGDPQTFPDGPGSATFIGAALQCDPTLVDFDATGTVHAFGPAVVPRSTYEIRFADQNCVDIGAPDDCLSAPALLTTAKWGDVARPFGGATQPNFIDISAIVDKFKSLSTALDKVYTQLQPASISPESPVNFLDVSAGVDAFRGIDYPFAGPGSCP